MSLVFGCQTNQIPEKSWSPKLYKTSYEFENCRLVRVSDDNDYIKCDAPEFVSGYMCMSFDDLEIVYEKCLEQNK